MQDFLNELKNILNSEILSDSAKLDLIRLAVYDEDDSRSPVQDDVH